MKICFVYRGYENLGIEYLSAVLKEAGFQVELIYDPGLFANMFTSNKVLKGLFDFSPGLVEAIFKINPDLICFSVVANDFLWASNLAKSLKEKRKDIPIIFGGIYPTSVPEEVIRQPFVDYVCVGEGEEALVELVDALKQGKDTRRIDNIWTKDNGRVISNPVRRLNHNLDALPYPDKALFHSRYSGFSRDFYTIITARGCPYSCTYCYSSYLKKLYSGQGNFYRCRSIDNVIEELKIAKEKYSPGVVTFFDDCFMVDKSWLKLFSQKYKEEIAIPTFCFVHPALVDEESISYLLDMNCHAVNLGIQTFDEELRRKYLKRTETNQTILSAVRQFKRTKIFLYVDVILGLPYQDEKELLEIARFINYNKPDSVFISWLTCFPKIEIVNIIDKLKPFRKEDINKSVIPKVNYIYIKELASVANLIMFSHILSKSLFNYIVNKKLYRFFPPLKYSFAPTNAVLLYIVSLLRRLFSFKKSTVPFSAWGMVKYYLFFIQGALLKSIISRKKNTF